MFWLRCWIRLRDKVEAQDRLALMTFDRSTLLAQDFTGRSESILAALDGVRYENGPQVLDGLAQGASGGIKAKGREKTFVSSLPLWKE